ncbi:MAG: ATP synthase subunit I [Andreesenia angusta]|nr:ATP synthase subunit I [Andreesenia angusta]
MALGQDYVRTIIKRSLLLIFIGCLIAFIVFRDSSYVLGILFGGLINILSFKIIEISTKKIVNMPENRARTYATINYFIRFIIYGIVLVIASKADYIDFISTIIALFTVKIVIVSDSVYDTFKIKRMNKD